MTLKYNNVLIDDENTVENFVDKNTFTPNQFDNGRYGLTVHGIS